MMYYTVYKITNIINDKIYVGVHKTIDINDGYFGSGKIIVRAIEKYGIENFVKEILATFDNSEDMFAMEAVIVNENFIKDLNTYNIKEGGYGGFDHLNNGNQRHLNNRFNKEYQTSISGFKNFSQEERKKYSKLGGAASRDKKTGFHAPGKRANFKGKKHTEAAKQKIGAANSINQKGEKNSQYGKPRSTAIKDKIRQTLLSKPNIKCPHCDIESNNKGVMNKWHFDNCKNMED